MSDIDNIMRHELSRLSGGPVTEEKKPKDHVPGLISPEEASPFKKFINTFLEEDLPTAITTVWKKQGIPAIKGFVSDMVMNTVNRMLYKDGQHGPGTFQDYGGQSTLVRNVVRASASNNNVQQSQAKSARIVSLDDLYFPTRSSAKYLIDCLNKDIERQGYARVSDVYEHLSKPDNPVVGKYPDNYHGWTSLADAYVRPAGNSFKVILPRPIQLDI